MDLQSGVGSVIDVERSEPQFGTSPMIDRSMFDIRFRYSIFTRPRLTSSQLAGSRWQLIE